MHRNNIKSALRNRRLMPLVKYPHTVSILNFIKKAGKSSRLQVAQQTVNVQ